MERPKDLPLYVEPPLVEVVLELQFEQPAAFGSVHYGEIWREFKSDFPVWEERNPLVPQFELPQERPKRGLPKLEFSQGLPPGPRLWMKNGDETRLLQFQPDRMILNWRKTGDEETYPHYEAIRQEFADAFQRLSKAMATNGLPVPVANQCEITYVNHLTHSSGQNAWMNLNDWMSMATEDPWRDPEAPIENIQIVMRHELRDSSNKWWGRLLVDAQPAVTDDEVRVIQLQLSARGRPNGDGLDAVLNFMDLARTKIINRFTTMTTKEMHKIWRRRD